jgi:hypothetical protein
MNIRIYQSYYLPEQISHLDPDGIPFDNTQNFLPELREYPIMQQIQHRCRLDQVDLWGMFSWKFTQKMNDLGSTVVGNKPEEFRQFVSRQIEMWAEGVKISGATVD